MNVNQKKLVAGIILKSIILFTPLLIFVILFAPYERFNKEYVITVYTWKESDKITEQFWFSVAVFTTLVSGLMSIAVFKKKKWHRILWTVIMFVISLLVAKLCCYISPKWR